MKITYTPNPLETIVELDEHEIEALRLKLKLEQYEDMMFSAHFAITDRLQDRGSLKALSIEEALAEARGVLDPDRWCSDGASKVDQLVEERLRYYLEELKGAHSGDCTASPSPCVKCHAEQALGIDTLGPGASKAVLHSVHCAFSRWNPATKQHDLPPVTLDLALSRLDDDAHAYLLSHQQRCAARGL